MRFITRHLKREASAASFSAGRRRAVIVERNPQTPGLVGFRLKGTRTTYYLPIDHCFREAMKNELARRKLERRLARRDRQRKEARHGR